MTASRIIELADEIATEVLCDIQHFALDRIAAVEDMLIITFRWSDTADADPTVALIIRPADHQTDDSARTEIRRQLRAACFQTVKEF